MDRSPAETSLNDPRPLSAGALEVARGISAFLGVFSLVNAAAGVVSHRSQDVWWIAYDMVPSWLGAATGLMAACLLVAFAVRPRMGMRRRILTAGALITLASVAVSNSLGYYVAWSDGAIRPGVPVPFSAVLASTFAWLTYVSWNAGRASAMRYSRSMVVAVVLAAAVAFPLMQVAFFGTTDYRRPAAAAVVLGAKVHDNGVLSSSLANRVRTAVSLYEEGLTTRIVMSGGVGDNGVDEAAAMRDFAVLLGVPAEAISLDSRGINTDASVRNTCAMVGPGERLLVVSSFYHLPRIKLAYRAAGCDVLTVPAVESRKIAKTPIFVAREVPGFWVYWARSVWRDLGSKS